MKIVKSVVLIVKNIILFIKILIFNYINLEINLFKFFLIKDSFFDYKKLYLYKFNIFRYMWYL